MSNTPDIDRQPPDMRAMLPLHLSLRPLGLQLLSYCHRSCVNSTSLLCSNLNPSIMHSYESFLYMLALWT